MSFKIVFTTDLKFSLCVLQCNLYLIILDFQSKFWDNGFGQNNSFKEVKARVSFKIKMNQSFDLILSLMVAFSVLALVCICTTKLPHP